MFLDIFTHKIMYGEFKEGLSNKGDKYGFVNENHIRIEAGVGLIGAIYSSISVIFFAEFTIPMIIVFALMIDFMRKIFIGPNKSIFSCISHKVSKGKPYLVGAIQKRFAWSIGLFLTIFVLFCMLILSGTLNNFGIMTHAFEQVSAIPIHSPMAIPMNPAIIACALCIIFMTLESIFGYCVGCKMYQKLVQWGVMKEVKGQNCAGGVCER